MVAACERLSRVVARAWACQPGARTAAGEAVNVPITRYALASIRQRILPATLEGWPRDDPVHVVMFGGTNSGKSTILNVLLGREAAGMSFRARFSQHPEAYRSTALGDGFLEGFPTRFEGYARYVDEHPPRQEDDVLRSAGYRPALAVIDASRMSPHAIAQPAVHSVVFWDTPDFSTEEAQLYLPALFDTIALADLVIMCVTRENYADHRGRLLRGLVLDSGVPLVVVANKLEPGSSLIDDVRRKLGSERSSGMSRSLETIMPLPEVSGDGESSRLARLIETQEAVALRRRVAVQAARGQEMKQVALRGTLGFLQNRFDEIVAPLHARLGQSRRWRMLVDETAEREFYDVYRRDYLNGEGYVDFNVTLVKLMDLLEIPGIGPFISGVSKGLRSASRWVIGTVVRGVRRLFGGGRERDGGGPELDVVAGAFERWVVALRGEAQALAEKEDDSNWPSIARTLESNHFLDDYADRLGEAYLEYRGRMDELTARRARALYALISERPALLNTLRGMKVTLDVGTTALVVSSGGLDWTDAVIGPLVAPFQRLILEFGLDRYMDVQKRQLKDEQFHALRGVVEDRMIGPVRGLYRVEVSADELALARASLVMIGERLCGGVE